VDDVTGALRASGLRPEHLRLELTESVLLSEPDSALAVLARLRALGVQVHLDDFGTGYSSLSYLARFPVRALKIDRAFVTGLPDHSRNLAITRAIVHMGKALGLSLVAEGVETKEQSQTLTSLGCDSLQGYLFAPPLESRKAFSILKSMGLATAEEASEPKR
jgi:EAL domain-containing protein (putative c-di-GMP-specific phosphodiesterase class I)